MEGIDIRGSIFDWEANKKMIYPVLLPMEEVCAGVKNSQRVHRTWLDLAIGYVTRLSHEKNANMCLSVRESLRQAWNVDEEVIYQQAMSNLKQEDCLIERRKQRISKFEKKQVSEWKAEWKGKLDEDFEPEDIWILSNQNYCYGAAEILDNEKIKQVAMQLGKKNLCIVPVNTHEVMLIPEKDAMDFEKSYGMLLMLRIIYLGNPYDRLANHCYYYNLETEEICYWL